MDDLAGLGGEELDGALAGLRTINRWLGGHRTTRRAFDDLARRTDLGTQIEVLDVGGGSGDLAPVILEWARRRGLGAHVVVLDLHPTTAQRAAERLQRVAGAEARHGDLFDVPERSFDVVHASLVLHHFDGDEAVRALVAMRRIARKGVVVNDLHRHPVPWALIRWLTLAATRNEALRFDGPLSVARAFTREDWKRLGGAAGLDFRWRWTWAWRWAVSGVPR
jgi:ubiquinone/menaquinone biosynthesis C-methylase UbiE